MSSRSPNIVLRDVLPEEVTSGPEYDGARVLSFLDAAVLREHDGLDRPWPGRHKNVLTWWELRCGHAVGWNENPATGWSFPVMGPRALRRRRGGAA